MGRRHRKRLQRKMDGIGEDRRVQLEITNKDRMKHRWSRVCLISSLNWIFRNTLLFFQIRKRHISEGMLFPTLISNEFKQQMSNGFLLLDAEFSIDFRYNSIKNKDKRITYSRVWLTNHPSGERLSSTSKSIIEKIAEVSRHMFRAPMSPINLFLSSHSHWYLPKQSWCLDETKQTLLSSTRDNKMSSRHN